MPIEYTETGRIKRVQADSILETKLVINEMQQKKIELEAQQRQLALDTSLMRASYKVVAGSGMPARQAQSLPPTLARKRLEEAIRPVELRRIELQRTVANMEQCIRQLDGYLSQIMGSGLKAHDFHLHYQPIVNLETGLICGFEALVRWQRAGQGFTFPNEFIPVAEETGLIVHLDRWVLLEACRQLRAWQQQFPDYAGLTVSVNLSGAQLVQDDFVDCLADVLQQTGVAAEHLKLEVTESALVENIEALVANVDRLRSLGLQINIDDFGAGDTSLNTFNQLPFGSLVMDRSLVSQLDNQNEGRRTVEAIIELAHSHEMRVVAKGVETTAQLEELRSMAGEYAQGYLFSKPLDIQAATNLIAQGRQW